MQTNQQEEEQEDLPRQSAKVVIKIYPHDLLWKGIAHQVLRQYFQEQHERQTKEPVHYVPYSES